jgi:hypothetical protein
MNEVNTNDSEKKVRSILVVRSTAASVNTCSLFAWLISHQPAVLFSQNKPATNNQPAVLFSQNKPAPAISHQPNEQAVDYLNKKGTGVQGSGRFEHQT